MRGLNDRDLGGVDRDNDKRTIREGSEKEREGRGCGVVWFGVEKMEVIDHKNGS